MRSILVTGAAGFIGAALVKRLLLERNIKVIGIDNINNYYSPDLKKKRLNNAITNLNDKNLWKFYNTSIENQENLKKIFHKFKPNIVVHLAAQAGVRYSIENPSAYIQSNLVGFGNILEMCREFKVENLIYASSSSVYGGNTKLPFKEEDSVDHPVSLYAATKKSNELMAHSYSHLFNLPVTGLRFFTVYGPWGRPDMAPMIFADAILNNKEIKIFNHGEMMRDFTYIDDIVEAVFRCCFKPASIDKTFDTNKPFKSSSFAPYRILNLGNSNPIKLLKFIDLLEKALGKEAKKTYLPMQPGDVVSTNSDTSKLETWINYKPKISIEEGIEKFAEWYLNYFKK